MQHFTAQAGHLKADGEDEFSIVLFGLSREDALKILLAAGQSKTMATKALTSAIKQYRARSILVGEK